MSPVPVVVKAKSCASFGTASLMMVMVPRLVLVKVQLTVSPAARLIVALRVPRAVIVPPLVGAGQAGEVPASHSAFSHGVRAGY